MGINKKFADSLVKVATEVRGNTDLSKDISTRELLEVAEMVADGYKPMAAFEWTVLQKFDGNSSDGGERSTVKAILQSL